jgi:hypothetical protein
MSAFWIDTIGWAGSVLVVLAFGLNSYHKISAGSLAYQLMNLVGGIFLIVHTLYKGAYPNTFVNVVWVVIAVPAIIRILRKGEHAVPAGK